MQRVGVTLPWGNAGGLKPVLVCSCHPNSPLWAGRFNVKTWTYSLWDKVCKSLPWRVVSWEGLEKSMRSENERGHLAWAEALRKFKVPCQVPSFLSWKDERRNINSRAGFMLSCLSLPLQLAHHRSAGPVTTSEITGKRKMTNSILFCTGSWSQTEVPLVLSTWNFVDQSTFWWADICLSVVELDLILIVGGKGSWRALICKIIFSKF